MNFCLSRYLRILSVESLRISSVDSLRISLLDLSLPLIISNISIIVRNINCYLGKLYMYLEVKRTKSSHLNSLAEDFRL